MLIKYRLYLLSICAVLIVSCSNEACQNDNLLTIYFHNVSEFELQNLKIIAYKKNGEFNDVTSTDYEVVSFEYGVYDDYTHIGILNRKLNLGYDYKIIYEDINDSCLITDIIDDKQYCGGPFFYEKHVHNIDGYKMNDGDFACDVLKTFPTRSK